MAELYILLNNPGLAISYAQKSLDYNRYNVSALETKIVATRLKGEDTGDLIREMQEIDPLNHLAAYEAFVSDRSHAKKEDFSKRIDGEFPEENYLELALYYHATGLSAEAGEILSMGPSCVKNNLWLAYIKRTDDPDASMDLLSAGITASPEFVFPYRLETLDMLAWAKTLKPSWKLDYYQALAYAAVDRNEEAVELLTALKDQPGSWVFYQTRATFLAGTDPEQQKHDLIRARDLAPESWRTWDQLIRYYLANHAYTLAADLAGEASGKFPDNFILGALHARALVKAGAYQQSIKILKNIHILPSEGTTAGHNVWRDAHIRLGVELIGKKKYKSAVKALREAMEWPENLGVGKPYDPEQRNEELLLAYCYDKLGNSALADEQLQHVVDYTRKTTERSVPDHYLGLLALKHLGKAGEADALLQQINDSPTFNSDTKQWINDRYRHVDRTAQARERDSENMKLVMQVASIFDE